MGEKPPTLGAMPRKPKEPTLETARTVGERIRAAYLAKGMTRAALMRALGVAYTTIYAWERDESLPTTDNLRALSVVTGVPTSVLLGETEPMTEADYGEWGRFLSTPEGKGMHRHERVALGSMRFEQDDPPSVERYRALLVALRGTRSSRNADGG